MIRDIVHDPMLLSKKSSEAGIGDLGIVQDLQDTLKAYSGRCVGMAANMIGFSKRIIIVDQGFGTLVMLNPVIVEKSDPYETEEGCLSVSGIHKASRYKKIRVQWQNTAFKTQTGVFSGFTAQIIQHELDHLDGILV